MTTRLEETARLLLADTTTYPNEDILRTPSIPAPTLVFMAVEPSDDILRIPSLTGTAEASEEIISFRRVAWAALGRVGRGRGAK